jgi:hypothetical protein
MGICSFAGAAAFAEALVSVSRMLWATDIFTPLSPT